MKMRDLINICIHNLFRHKSRTILTVLGVIIGCCAVVIMISFGIGMKISQEAMLAEMGDLQVIEVYNQSDKVKLTESIIQQINDMPEVIGTNPKMNITDTEYSVKAGANDRYSANYPSIVGIKKDAVDNFGYEIEEGTGFTEKNGDVIEALCGKYFAYSLFDTQRPEGYNMVEYWSYLYDENGEENPDNLPEPYIDPLDATFKLVLGSENDGGTNKPVTFTFKIVGILKDDYSKGYETVEGLMFNADDLKKIIKQYKISNNIAEKGEASYDQILVKADEINNVADVESKIKEMGFYTYSLESVREPMEKEVRQKQLMFAGLGIVSLFVAALGIMNTMIMAISERKKEIGLMKALGCPVNGIRAMFLMEAGFIGLLGGVLGAVISLIISCGINIVSAELEIMDFNTLLQVLFTNTDRVSVVPVWLAATAIVFSVFVGVASGYYPANKAVKVSVLDALRAE